MEGDAESPRELRYGEEGERHLDFHRTMNGTIGYLRRTYGSELLDATFRRTAHHVYRSIWEDLQAGDPEQLIAHWRHFFDREEGDYTIERDGDTVTLTVERCPAIAYLQARGIAIDPDFCRQTEVVNTAWSEQTPFEISTEVLGDGRCVQTLRRRSS